MSASSGKNMKVGIVAFAFGIPSSIEPNRRLAKLAAEKARSLNARVYTQQDVMPLPVGIEVELTEENYPKRVPTLRIARGSVRWAKQQGISELWVCAAKPHIARATRDLKFAVCEANASISVKVCEGICRDASYHWFCAHSGQLDTRFAPLWYIRDGILRHMPMRLYSFIAG